MVRPRFNQYQTTAFDRVTSIMGELAVWHKEGGDIEGEVLFKDPSKKYKLGGVDYMPPNFSLEYREGFFDQLYELTRDEATQYVTVSGADYWVRHVDRAHDGKTFIAVLEPKL